MNRISDKPLNPTLWRTCRVLSGRTRFALLRRILMEPGASVSQFAEAEGISLPRASQELRRLQSRGIIGVRRMGRRVEYVPEADPLVNAADLLLTALKKTCRQLPSSADERICRLADGMGHEKRIMILRQLQAGPQSVHMLRERTGCTERVQFHHLQILLRDGWVNNRNHVWRVETNRDVPLAICLLKLI